MAKWTITPRTEENTMKGVINYDDRGFQQEITQDITEHLKAVKHDKELLASASHKDRVGGYRKMATIPDVVALQILENHRLDLHHPAFMSDPANMNKLRRILKTEYPELLIST